MTAAMDAEISHFMFHHYCAWFSKEDVGEAFASIPQVSPFRHNPKKWSIVMGLRIEFFLDNGGSLLPFCLCNFLHVQLLTHENHTGIGSSC